nr:putative holin-like toxin [Paenibacillus yonginensis]
MFGMFILALLTYMKKE